jgi:uncharacterized membrane protein
MTNDEKIKLIGQKIFLLSNNLDKYKQELDLLKSQLEALQSGTVTPPVIQKEVKPVTEEIKVPQPEIQQPNIINEIKVENLNIPPVKEPTKKEPVISPNPLPKSASLSFEERVGAKWFSIIGIITLVIGIAIGVKYAIDKDLINEVTRLVLGYVAGSIILVLALFYKKKYSAFSSVLLSGAMAVMYFTTYVGYSYYHFYNATVAFLIMSVFTGFTVYAAYIYNYEVVALVALVGGYALPLLLSTGGGEIQYMFGFMLILNGGILALSFLKYWKFVNHVAYALTWFIFTAWMSSEYKPEIYFGRTLFFSTAFYILFYMSFISYKVFRNKPFSAWDVILILSNSLVYFGIGYSALDHLYYDQYLGLFCVLNAVIHLGFAMLCKKKEVSDKTIYYFIISMVISFITMAIPVQLDGNFVTIVWVTELVVLLYMSKRFQIPTYRNLSYVIMWLAFFSLIDDWGRYHDLMDTKETILGLHLFRNHYFLTSVYAALGFVVAQWLNRNMITNIWAKIVNVSLIVIAIFTSYQAFANEIVLYCDTRYLLSETKHFGEYGYDWTDYDHSWRDYKTLVILMYSVLFFSVLGLLSIRKFGNRVMAFTTWGINLFLVIVMFTVGFLILSELRSNAVYNDAYTQITTWNYNFRYVFLPFAFLPVFMIYMYRNSELLAKVRPINTWLFHVCILFILSNELTHIMTMTHLDNYDHYRKVSYRMGYTVLWGLYSMALIVYGILRKRKILRIIAISLFGLTIVKLAIDAMSMSRGYQLIVFVTIGIILLIVSFMYQKFKPLLFGEENKQEPVINPENPA